MDSCPSPEILSQLSQGSLSHAEVDSVGAHVAECAECQQVLASLLDSEPTVDVPKDYNERLHLTRGHIVGRYVVLSLLGEGGMGSVYLAYDPELDRKVALKLVQWAALRSTTAALVQVRLAREAQAMARLSHPNVVAVHDVLMVDGKVYVAMEYVEGGTLRSWLDAEPAPTIPEVLAAFIEAGQGLAAAHSAGIVHRDFKPANVLIGAGAHRRIKVTDFGVARALDAPDSDTDLSDVMARGEHTQSRLSTPMTQVGAVVGTPAYLSPESYRGGPVGALSDQFSFCVALYEALYGERPFTPGQGLTLEQAVAAGRLNPAPAGNRVPGWLRKVVLKGLSLEPHQRYPSMDALLAALKADPQKTRRRWLTAGAITAVTVALTGFVTYRLTTRTSPCQGGEQRLTGVWDDAARAQLKAAFAAVGTPIALDATNTVQETLDRYASAWIGAHRDACEATVVRHEQSEAMQARRMECLSLKLNDLRDLVSQLRSVDTAMAGKAIDAAVRLPDIGQCADETGLAREILLPSEPSLRQQAEALLSELSTLRNSIYLGRYDASLLASHEARMEKIRTLNIPGLEPEALLLLGKLQLNFEGIERSEKTLELAVTQALASRRFDLMTSAIHSLLRLLYAKREFQDVPAWVQLGEAALVAAGSTDALRCQFWGTKAAVWASMSAEETSKAINLIPQLLEVCRRADPDNALAEADVEQMVGNILLTAAKNEEAQTHLERSLERYRYSLGNHHDLVGLALQNMAANFQSMGKFEDAAKLATQAEEIFTATGAKTIAVYSLRLLCEVHQSMGNVEAALDFCNRAATASTEIFGKDSQAHVTGLGMRAVALLRAKRMPEARATFDEMMKTARALKLERSQETATAYLEYLETLELPRERPLAKELVDIASEVLTHPSIQDELANIKAWKAQHLDK